MKRPVSRTDRLLRPRGCLLRKSRQEGRSKYQLGRRSLYSLRMFEAVCGMFYTKQSEVSPGYSGGPYYIQRESCSPSESLISFKLDSR